MIDPFDLGGASGPVVPIPQPAPIPIPTSAPDPVVAPTQSRWQTIRTWVEGPLLVAIVVLLAFNLYRTYRPSPQPTPPPVADGVELGRTFVPKLAAALADGFEASDRFLSQGKSFQEANDILKQTFHDSREKAFNEHAGAAITAIVPEGTELKDESQRAAIRKLESDFARGLRGGR